MVAAVRTALLLDEFVVAANDRELISEEVKAHGQLITQYNELCHLMLGIRAEYIDANKFGGGDPDDAEHQEMCYWANSQLDLYTKSVDDAIGEMRKDLKVFHIELE